MAIPTNVKNFGNLVPTTTNFDVSRIQEVDVKSPEFKELLVRLYQSVNNIVLSLNNKDTGLYVEQEFLTGVQYFPRIGTAQQDYRNEFRMTVNFGALPAAGTKTVAHGISGINSSYVCVGFYGAGTKTTVPITWIPLPYPATNPLNVLEVSADSTNISITTGGKDYSEYNAIIVLRFLKS